MSKHTGNTYRAENWAEVQKMVTEHRLNGSCITVRGLFNTDDFCDDLFAWPCVTCGREVQMLGEDFGSYPGDGECMSCFIGVDDGPIKDGFVIPAHLLGKEPGTLRCGHAVSAFFWVGESGSACRLCMTRLQEETQD